MLRGNHFCPKYKPDVSDKTKVLLVEDDPLLGDLVLSDLAALFPYGQLETVGPADSYAEAVDLLQKEQPDIALLDIELNGDNNAGIRIAQYINQTRPIPVIFLSGLPRQAGFDVAKFTSPVAFLQKPYQRQQLSDQLELVMVRLSQKRLLGSESPRTPSKASIFVTVGRNEMVPLPLKNLILLEADGKVIKAHLTTQETPIVFTSPGLKNFYHENITSLQESFFPLNRTYIINLQLVQGIKDNHVILPRFSENGEGRTSFFISIPSNNKKVRKALFEGLGANRSGD